MVVKFFRPPSNHGHGVFLEMGAFACPSLLLLKGGKGWMDEWVRNWANLWVQV